MHTGVLKDVYLQGKNEVMKFSFSWPGSYPELYTGWGRGSGNCSRVHANALRLSDCGILLWHHLNTGLYFYHGTASLYFNVFLLL